MGQKKACQYSFVGELDCSGCVQSAVYVGGVVYVVASESKNNYFVVVFFPFFFSSHDMTDESQLVVAVTSCRVLLGGYNCKS